MALALYADECVKGRLVTILRNRKIDVVTADDQGLRGATDETNFARAIALGRVILTEDHDFLVLASRHLDRKEDFPGLLFIKPFTPIGTMAREIAVYAEVGEPADLKNQVIWIP